MHSESRPSATSNKGQIALASERTFGMVFEKANSIWAVAANDKCNKIENLREVA